jgi:hypothetical protein
VSLSLGQIVWFKGFVSEENSRKRSVDKGRSAQVSNIGKKKILNIFSSCIGIFKHLSAQLQGHGRETGF